MASASRLIGVMVGHAALGVTVGVAFEALRYWPRLLELVQAGAIGSLAAVGVLALVSVGWLVQYASVGVLIGVMAALVSVEGEPQPRRLAFVPSLLFATAATLATAGVYWQVVPWAAERHATLLGRNPSQAGGSLMPALRRGGVHASPSQLREFLAELDEMDRVNEWASRDLPAAYEELRELMRRPTWVPVHRRPEVRRGVSLQLHERYVTPVSCVVAWLVALAPISSGWRWFGRWIVAVLFVLGWGMLLAEGARLARVGTLTPAMANALPALVLGGLASIGLAAHVLVMRLRSGDARES